MCVTVVKGARCPAMPAAVLYAAKLSSTKKLLVWWIFLGYLPAV